MKDKTDLFHPHRQRSIASEREVSFSGVATTISLERSVSSSTSLTPMLP